MFHVANILGRTFEEVLDVNKALHTDELPHRFLRVIYWPGKLAIDEVLEINKRVILFSPVLRERTGHHMHGERWANRIKKELENQGINDRPIHLIRANMHSVMNYLFSKQILSKQKE